MSWLRTLDERRSLNSGYVPPRRKVFGFWLELLCGVSELDCTCSNWTPVLLEIVVLG